MIWRVCCKSETKQRHTYICITEFLILWDVLQVPVDVILKTVWNKTRLQKSSTCFNIAFTASKNIIHLAEVLVLHQRLAVMLFILRAGRIRGAVGTRNDNNVLAPVHWLWSKCLQHGVLPGKRDQCDVIKMWSGGSMHVMINKWWCSIILFFLQVILNSTRTIKAENNEIPWYLTQWKLQKSDRFP